MLLIGYIKQRSKDGPRKHSVFYRYFQDRDYLSLSGVTANIRVGTNGIELDTRTNIWCSEDDMRIQNLTIRRVRDYMGGYFITDFGKNRFFKFEGTRHDPAEAGCSLAFSNFGHNLIRMSLYMQNREFKGEQWRITGKFDFIDAINPRIFSNNVIVPFMIATLEEFFESAFVAILKYSDKKLSFLKNSRFRPEDLMSVSSGTTSIENAVSNQLSFQNLEQITNHFKSLDKRLDVAATLKKSYRRRTHSLYDSLESLIQRRHDIIHRGTIAINFTDQDAFKALEDLEEAVTRVYRMLGTAFGWKFRQDWSSGIRQLKKTKN